MLQITKQRMLRMRTSWRCSNLPVASAASTTITSVNAGATSPPAVAAAVAAAAAAAFSSSSSLNGRRVDDLLQQYPSLPLHPACPHYNDHPSRLRSSSNSNSSSSSSHRLSSTSSSSSPLESSNIPRKNLRIQSLITGNDGQTVLSKMSSNNHTFQNWRNKPLFRRQGDVRFKTGLEAAQLLVQEAKRRDGHHPDLIASIQSSFACLAPIFDRTPKYAFIAKTLMEPDRCIQFRVCWTDDVGVVRMNRGYRIQYSNTLGPYTGPLHFFGGSSRMMIHPNATNNTINPAAATTTTTTNDSSRIKTLAFETLLRNAVTGYNVGAAVGGSDFVPHDKSNAELQRFCQSYMTELAKYIGPGYDVPEMGMGVGPVEMGYLYGQYKRMGGNKSSSFMASSDRNNINSFMSPAFSEALGYGVVQFAAEMLKDRGETLAHKRVLILGGGKVARTVAQKLLRVSALPLTLSDDSGFVYEPSGFSAGQLRTIHKIKSDRGALLGRYIMSSTTAKFNEGSIFHIPCDLCIPCGGGGLGGGSNPMLMHALNDAAIEALAQHGRNFLGVVEGGPLIVTPSARTLLKKRGLLYGPHTMTLTGSLIARNLNNNNNATAALTTTNHNPSLHDDDDVESLLLADQVARIYQDVKATASEFNARGDLYMGSNILGFLRIANVMETHGAV